jgi:hypothetical protein
MKPGLSAEKLHDSNSPLFYVGSERSPGDEYE